MEVRYINGQLKTKLDFHNKRPIDGPVEFYRENGSKHYHGEFLGGLLHGEWKEFDSNGFVLAVRNYNKGRPFGNWTDFFSNQSQKVQYEIIEEKTVFKQFFDNGTLQHIGTILTDSIIKLKDLPHWDLFSFSEFYESFESQLKNFNEIEDIDSFLEAVFYKHVILPIKDGIWKEYNRDGKLIFEREYSSGRPTTPWKAYSPTDDRIIGELMDLEKFKSVSGVPHKLIEELMLSDKSINVRIKGVYAEYSSKGEIINAKLVYTDRNQTFDHFALRKFRYGRTFDGPYVPYYIKTKWEHPISFHSLSFSKNDTKYNDYQWFESIWDLRRS